MRKCTACNECRKLRRKCVRSSPYEICNRCIRFERECTAPGDISTESDSDDDDMNRLTKEFEDLNSVINQLEQQMRTLRRGEQRPQIAYHPQSTDSNNQWHLTIHNGRLRIETGIRNISDLLRSEPIRYLSPRLSKDQSNQDLIVHFSTGKTMRLRLLAVKLLVKCLNPKPDPSVLLLPTTFLFNTTLIIDKLVDIYFECHNIFRPMVHKQTFMAHYRQISSPVESLLCLCICCVVCACPCNHITHSYQELRYMGDYFAGLAKSKILDQFDVPEKRLETAMATNILGEYLYTVLKISEGLKLVTMGYQICMDLKPWFEQECKKPGKTSVECMLFSRHYSMTLHYNRLSDVIVHNTEKLRDVHYVEWKYVVDEPKQTIEFVKAQNWYYRLCNHPIMAKIRLYRHHLFTDSVHSLRFADIIRVDDIVLEWWQELPLKYRISENWLDIQQFKAKIDMSTDGIALIILGYFLSYMNDVYATLLTPNTLDGDAHSILSAVQERALKRALHCSQLAVYALHRLTKIESISQCQYTLAAGDCLIHTLDVLAILAISTNHIVRNEAKDMLTECMSKIDDLELMKNHKVDPLKSPLMTAPKKQDLNEINTSVYYEYPQPWYAAMYDMCHYLEKLHLTTSDPVLFPNLSIDF